MHGSTDRPSWEPEPSQPEVDRPAHRLNSGRRLWLSFTSPGEVFADIAIRPTWVLCLVLFVALGVAVQYAVLPHVDNEATLRARLGDRAEAMDEAQIERIIEQGESITRFVPLISLVAGPIIWGILAGVFFVMLKIVGSEVDYPRALSATLHAYWPPTVVGSVMMAALVQRVGKLPEQELTSVVKSHLGALLSPDTPAWLAAAASTISVFNVWTVILLVIGFTIVAKVPRNRAMLAALLPWAVYMVGKSGLAALFM